MAINTQLIESGGGGVKNAAQGVVSSGITNVGSQQLNRTTSRGKNRRK